MASPRNPPVPRLAPANSMSLPAALNAFGRANDPAWTGDEILADMAPEPSDEELAFRAFKRVTQQVSDDPRGAIDTDPLPAEHEVLAELHARRDIEFAERRRWQAAAMTFLRHLHRGALRPTAMGSDGRIYDVPPHLWAAESAEALFDNGGQLEVRGGQLVVPRRQITAEDTAIVLVNSDQLQALITAVIEGDASSPTVAVAPPAAGTPQLDAGGRRKPGRPSPTAQPIEEELRRRAAAGKCEPTLHAEAEVLIAWSINKYPNARQITVEGLENRIRDLYRLLTQPMK
jgi:hypothetical protein